MQRVIWIGLGLLACGLGAVGSGQAATAAYAWHTLNVGIELEPSGDLLVTETQSYDVNSKQALRLQRTIPMVNIDQIADVEVFENERPLAVSAGVKGEQFRIRWRAPRQPANDLTETRTFVVRYRVQGGVRVHPSGDQVVWTALFGDRESPLPKGAVTVQVPSDLAGEIQAAQRYGVPAAVQKLDARTVSFVPNAGLQPDETLRVKVIIPHGRLDLPIPNWQKGIDVPYQLPGLIGRIDVMVLIVVGIGLFAGFYYAISSTTYEEGNEMASMAGLDRYDGSFQRVRDRVTEYEKGRTNRNGQ